MNIVTCDLLGRMGNQIFIAASTIAYALKNKIKFHIPAHTLNDSVWKPIFTHLELSNFNANPPGGIIRLQEYSHAYQGEMPYHPHIWKQALIVVQGYRQSELYFQEYKDQVFDFLFPGFERKSEGLSVSLHYRLGDYKQHPTKHYIVDDEYIRNALKIMELKGVKKCVVFSDEISEAKQKINKEIFPEFDFEYSEGQSEVDDFKRMLNFDYHIISASSFSLTAAIFSKANYANVIAPRIWFLKDNEHLDVSTIYPKNCIRL